MSEGHSILAPSGASRWTVCTASVGFIEAHRLELDFSSSDQADEGTDAHALAAALLTGSPAPELKYRNAEMDVVVGKYVKFVKGIISTLSPEMNSYFETKVPLFYGHGNGTVDVLLVDRTQKRIYVIDLKYGAGVAVYAKQNKQLAIYAESALRGLDGLAVDDTWIIDLIIYQPRDRNDSEPLRQWAMYRSELAGFVKQIQTARDNIERGHVAFVADPTGHCKFCPAKPICEAFRNYGLSALPIEGVDRISSVPEPKQLTRAQRVRVIAGRKALEEWLEAVEDFEVAQLMHGADPLGFKLVEGKSNRTWTVGNQVKQILEEFLPEGTPAVTTTAPELISVADAEKLIGKKEFATLARFIKRPPGKPTLVPIDDKRPALNFGPSRDFEDLDAPAAKSGSEFI